MMASVSRVTSSAGISMEISRLTPSFFASAVSVGLTFSFRFALGPGWRGRVREQKAKPDSHAVHLSVKSRGAQRQSRSVFSSKLGGAEPDSGRHICESPGSAAGSLQGNPFPSSDSGRVRWSFARKHKLISIRILKDGKSSPHFCFWIGCEFHALRFQRL